MEYAVTVPDPGCQIQRERRENEKEMTHNFPSQKLHENGSQWIGTIIHIKPTTLRHSLCSRL